MADIKGYTTRAPAAEEIRRGRAPWREALYRILHNRLAMIGLLLVLVVLLPVLLAPWFTPYDPSYQHWWIGAQPPGYAHPHVLGETRLRIGEMPGVPEAARDASRLTILAREARRDEFRIVLRRNRISQLQQTRGALHLDELDLSSERWLVRVVQVNQEKTPLHLDGEVVLRLDQAVPAALRELGSRVIILERQERAATDEVVYEAVLDAGLVTALSRAGEAIPEVVIRATEVASIAADGKPLTVSHLLGTDQLGRDVLARVLYGGRISLLVGLVGTLVSLIIGVVYGAVSGYAGGRTDRLMMSGVDILYAVPFMFLVIILMVYFNTSILMLFVALGAVQWLTMARIVRGQMLSLKEKEYVQAARMAGARPHTIIFRHLVPNTLGPVIVYTTLTVPIVILQESFLAFIGLSVTFQGRALDSWGALVHQGMQFMQSDGSHNWLLLAPSAAMVMALLGMNCLGDGLRDVLDPRLDSK